MLTQFYYAISISYFNSIAERILRVWKGKTVRKKRNLKGENAANLRTNQDQR